MTRMIISEILGKKPTEEISFGGWVHDLRDLGNLRFIVLKDRTGFLQVTMPKKAVSEEVFKAFDNLTKESSVLVTGVVKEAKQAPNGVELIPSGFEIINKALAPTPIDTSGKIISDLSVRLDYRFLDLRDPKRMAIFKVRSKLFLYTAEFFDSKGFTGMQSPKITQAGVESGAELFEVNYFGKKAYLSQSPQIYKQMMVVAGFEKVYDIGTVFRAEKSLTTRHLTEFTGVDFEMGFINSEQDVMDVIEEYMKFVITKLKDSCAKEFELFGVNPVIPKKIPRITLPEAFDILRTKGKDMPHGEDPDPESERLLGDWAMKEHGEEFVFVTNYPWSKRPFYHMVSKELPGTTKSFDLLFNGVEVATGAQREHRYEVLKTQAAEKGLDLDAMKDYAMIFQYGVIPHGGVGFGLDRLVQRILRLDNIKEAILLPRDPQRLNP
ncbi:MAG: aspartate--tRNA(Asn) ligase [Candidatus Diapherotrites archaeon]|nr:aspartate--tRNA(Asn) ligase [Candidatus Diapherotrites archaeon]